MSNITWTPVGCPRVGAALCKRETYNFPRSLEPTTTTTTTNKTLRKSHLSNACPRKVQSGHPRLGCPPFVPGGQ